MATAINTGDMLLEGIMYIIVGHILMYRVSPTTTDRKRETCVPSHQDYSLIVCLIFFSFPSEKKKKAFAFVLKTKLWVGCGGSCLLVRSCSKGSAKDRVKLSPPVRRKTVVKKAC